jgi:hypothetical protein
MEPHPFDVLVAEVSRLSEYIKSIPAPMPMLHWDVPETDVATHVWLTAYERWYRHRPLPALTTGRTDDGLGRRSGW